MARNPYRWQHDHPTHIVPRSTLVDKIVAHLRRGVAVKLVGGRGMGKSVLLQQVKHCFAGEADTRVVIVPNPPLHAGALGCVEDIATRLELGPLPRMTMDAIMEAAEKQGIERIILLIDEADQYVLQKPIGDFARTWFNHLEAHRKSWQDRFAIVVAGGLGILHLGHVLGSGLVSRAETCIVERFGFDELQQLAAPFAELGRVLDANVLETLQALSGGNPALATHGLAHLWETSGPPLEALRVVFGEFPSHYGDFLREVHDAVSHHGLVAAPGRILNIVRQSEGIVSQHALRDACATDIDPPVDVVQAIQLLQAAGLVGVSGSLQADPVRIHPIASIVNFPSRIESKGDLVERFDAELAAVLAQLHRFGRDFHGRGALLEEQVFSSVLAVALEQLGWPADREPIQAAGYVDLRIQWRDGGHGEHALIEVKIWPRNDYKEIQAQISAYWVSETVHAVGVTLGTRGIAGWVEDYEKECLTDYAFNRLPTPKNLVGSWHVTETLASDIRRTTHFLVQIPKRD